MNYAVTTYSQEADAILKDLDTRGLAKIETVPDAPRAVAKTGSEQRFAGIIPFEMARVLRQQTLDQRDTEWDG